jgi:hypothetical protein
MAAKRSSSGRNSNGKTTISSPGKAPVSFNKGGLHRSTGTPAGQKIPAGKMAQAASGALGPLAQKQANMAKGMLAAGRKTAAGNRKKKSS